MNLYKEQENTFETLRKRLKLENFNYREVF